MRRPQHRIQLRIVHVLPPPLADIDRASAALLAQTGKVGLHLRDNDWLMTIKQRTAIPGGVCEFDLPAYHYWLHSDDPDFEAKALAIGRLYRDAPRLYEQGELVVCVDEKPSVQPRTRKAPTLAAQPGQPAPPAPCRMAA